MALGMLGLKVGMTQVYDEAGTAAPVTVLQVGPCPVLQIRNQERDGYDAVQVGFQDKPRRKAIRAERGHVSADLGSKRRERRAQAGVVIPPKADCEPQRYIREFRLNDPAELEVGAVLTCGELFGEVKAVDVTGTSKGRGTAGAMKRHGFKGLKASHGAKKVHRSPGSTSSLCSNRGLGRPKKGKKMPGRHGNARITIRNLRVVQVDPENHLILVEGAVPGPNGGLISIRPTNKTKHGRGQA